MTSPALAQPPATVAVAFDARASAVRIAEGLADRASGRAVTADDPGAGTGLAFVTTAVPDDEPRGRSAFTRREEDTVRRANATEPRSDR